MGVKPLFTLEQYSGGRHMSDIQVANAKLLIERVTTLAGRAERDGVKIQTNPATGSCISGHGNGGFRAPDCTDGAPGSSHKEGQGVDIYDPEGQLDNWIMANRNALTELGLAIEHPSSTRRWSHLTTRLPPSGNRIFYP